MFGLVDFCARSSAAIAWRRHSSAMSEEFAICVPQPGQRLPILRRELCGHSGMAGGISAHTSALSSNKFQAGTQWGNLRFNICWLCCPFPRQRKLVPGLPLLRRWQPCFSNGSEQRIGFVDLFDTPPISDRRACMAANIRGCHRLMP